MNFRLVLCALVFLAQPSPGAEIAAPPPPPLDAVMALQAAASDNDPRAEGILAALLWTGATNDAEMEGAESLAQTAAKTGDPFGKFAAGRIALAAEEAKVSRATARRWCAEAFAGLKPLAAAGDPWALFFRGEILRLGLGAPSDPALARKFQDEARERGCWLTNLEKGQLRSAAPAFHILFLGDSMSLCGFGKTLDQRLRADPRVSSVDTYMACGTNPLSWLREPPYTNIKTNCGYWTIESVAGSKRPKEFQDTYGSTPGRSPGIYVVPKVEDLLPELRPNILIVQLSTNLLSLFPDGHTIVPARDGPLVRHHIAFFLERVLAANAPIQRIYWVGAPTSGRVTPAIQDFICQQTNEAARGVATVIDSRELISYPYKEMQVDNEHFVGVEMDQWADKVYHIIRRDLIPLALLPPAAAATLDRSRLASRARGKPRDDAPVKVRAKLILKSRPLEPKQLLPYREGLVAYLYEVSEVLKGRYEPRRMVVMHPSHIRLKPQNLEQWQVGQTYDLEVETIYGTPWETIRARDETGEIDLLPYIQLDDEARFPGTAPAAGEKQPPP